MKFTIPIGILRAHSAFKVDSPNGDPLHLMNGDSVEMIYTLTFSGSGDPKFSFEVGPRPVPPKPLDRRLLLV